MKITKRRVITVETHSVTICAPAKQGQQACPKCGYSVAPGSTDDKLNLIGAEPVVAMQLNSSAAAGTWALAEQNSITLPESRQTETTPRALLSQKQK
jgi:hypothetical protein